MNISFLTPRNADAQLNPDLMVINMYVCLFYPLFILVSNNGQSTHNNINYAFKVFVFIVYFAQAMRLNM